MQQELKIFTFLQEVNLTSSVCKDTESGYKF